MENQQSLNNNFDYQKFDYRRSEFDNVPPVVLRFLFFLELNLKPVNQKLREDLEKQSTSDLRSEVLEWN
jgi:hypothetical protein